MPNSGFFDCAASGANVHDSSESICTFDDRLTIAVLGGSDSTVPNDAVAY